MTNLLKNAFWALYILWEQKDIAKIDRYRLWRKSLRLYLSMLGFADKLRPQTQLRRLMICAVLSAIYDYDTDWRATANPETSIFFRLLNKLLKNQPECEAAIAQAQDLFTQDWKKQLSADGLERGSIALSFYVSVIRSQWLLRYANVQILDFGRSLQIVDDFLDLEQDQRQGDLNCFLTADAEKYEQELRLFFDSEFFRSLENHSLIYSFLKYKCLKKLGLEKQIFKQLFETTHPKTGPYAFVAVLLGFNFFPETSWAIALLLATVFMGITWSIMSFNDIVDRDHDRKKGKTFASENPIELIVFWFQLSGLTLLLLVVGFTFSPWAALFCLGIWFLGLMYSFMQRIVLIQNWIVAVCSASPVLVSAFYNGYLLPKQSLVFIALVFLIASKEAYLDIKDRLVDKGYKKTLSSESPGGYAGAVMYTNSLALLFGLVLLLYPNIFVNLASLLTGVAAFKYSRLLLHPELAIKSARYVDVMVMTLFATVFVSQIGFV